ncbi:MATE family efflux transporter [Terrimonas sp. NA20]|uniref:Multidrug-efflux transporter n=1 Tax=Terrimonas ginsenosidimutans TaxID=2908004 RepID=A0ABS9KWJ0_9BACT|nr:MATE family efflux transporter [Terrimonas ginsenosidimutans]MCG2616675.1 MATE family efflux transporter [Terrimonas ginsenosidimutans]
MANIAPNTDLRVEISTKQILKIALPISLALLVPQLNFVANTVFLGGLGETELGAAGITGVFYLVFALVGSGLNSGLQALIARRAGENRPEEIGKMFAQAIWIALGFAFANIIITYLLGSLFLSTVLHHETIRQEASLFISIRILGLPFLYLFQIGNALLVGTNNSRYMKYGFIAEAVLNIFLDYGLIYGKFGLPQLGFNGAAIASVFAEIAGAVIVFAIIVIKKLHLRFSLFRYLAFDKQLSGLIFRQSSPLILQFVLSVGAWLLFYILIENSGTGEHAERPLAISNTMRTVFAVFGVFVWAFANTSNAMVSNIIGQKRQDEVLILVKKIAKLSLLFTAFLSILINIAPHLFLSIFSKDTYFIQESIPVLRIVSVSLLLMSISAVCLNAVTGTANTKINLAIEIVAIIVYGIYVYLVLRVWHLPLVVAWASEFVYWSVIFCLSSLYLRSGRWKNKVI